MIRRTQVIKVGIVEGTGQGESAAISLLVLEFWGKLKLKETLCQFSYHVHTVSGRPKLNMIFARYISSNIFTKQNCYPIQEVLL